MNFSFSGKSKISSVFAISNVYGTCVLEVCDFLYKLGAFFTSRGQMNELVLLLLFLHNSPPGSMFPWRSFSDDFLP